MRRIAEMANEGLVSYRTGFFVVSVALGALLLLRVRGAPVETTPPVADSAAAIASPAPSSETDVRGCTAQLAACRTESWNVVVKAVTSDVEARGRTGAQRTGEPPVET